MTYFMAEEVGEYRRLEMHEIENNDRKRTICYIGDSFQEHHLLPPDDNYWERLGTAIGRNTQLKTLKMLRYGSYKGYDEAGNAAMETLLRGIANNRSIRWLELRRYDYDIDIYSLLAPFFKNNEAYESLKIDFHNELEGNTITRDICINLVRLLQNKDSKLVVLNLIQNNIDDELASILAIGLGGNNTLKKLRLGCNDRVTEIGWRAICIALQSPDCSLEKLCLHKCCSSSVEIDVVGSGFNDTALLHLTNTLRNNSSIKSLYLSENKNITLAGWNVFIQHLHNHPNSALEKLDMGGNNINDDTIYSITNTLVNNNKIRKIILDKSHAVTAAAWQSFSAVLQSPNSVLETLGLKFNSPFNDETLVILVSSLGNNTALKELILVVEDEEQYDGEDICELFSDDCWETVIEILCNTTSIMSTYNSNHTLERLSDPCDYCSSNEDGYWMPEEVRSLLVINQDSNRQAARLKIIQTHFSGSEINVQPFVDMFEENHSVIPHAMAWMVRDDERGVEYLYDEELWLLVNRDGLNILYQFLRSMPGLLEGTDKSQSRKRKAF